MQRISKFSVKQILTGSPLSRKFSAKGGKGGCDKGKGSDSKKGGGAGGGSKCAPLEKFDLCASKAGGMGGVGRKSSCDTKKPPAPKGSTAATLRKVCLFGVLPAVFLLNILILGTRTHKERQEYKPWPHMYKRDKRFAWGDGVKSFFHNPHTNALPEIGYEDDI